MAWSNLGGGDHEGANWSPSDGTQIAGDHTNVGIFSVLAGRTVTVRPYDGTNYGQLRIEARDIQIGGTLSADEAGHPGGAGGGGGAGGNGGWKKCTANFGGAGGNATPGMSPGSEGLDCITALDHCTSGACCSYAAGRRGGNGRTGSGTYGGAGGSYGNGGRAPASGIQAAIGENGTSGERGGYRGNGINGDSSTAEVVYMGGGGGAGGGGGGGGSGNQNS